jgi:aminopeptidase N
MQREFKYYPEDFARLPVRVIHHDLLFDVYDDHTRVDACLNMKALSPLRHLALDANGLEVLDVSCDAAAVASELKKDENKLLLHFGTEIPAGTEFAITTRTICRPTRNVLEGLYYDETPAGAPPTQITQCQQWGFQRLVPCLDDMAVKCTYRTTIRADRRYTRMISNGDVAVQRRDTGGGRDEIVYSNEKTPMAPYLFFLGVGTWDAFTREFEYPDGDIFTLELLAPPGADPEAAAQALEILHNGVLWVRLFTGPGSSLDGERRRRLFDLVLSREEMKRAGKDLRGIREEIRKAAAGLESGYKYTGTVYREIAMQNSNFGGMENVGNTTIIANRLMPYPVLPDAVFEYMIAVKLHEFYHNENGSEVTGMSPFELWLNEAVTCFVESEYMAFVAGEQYTRLKRVMRIVMPDGGTMDHDTGATSMPILPEGFNYPDDLISAVTYSKAPEFVRMVERIMGREKFNEALGLYFSLFRHANATTADWITAMNEASGLGFDRMAEGWLHRTGYPVVKVLPSYRDGMLRLRLLQAGRADGGHWELPFSVAAVNDRGEDIASRQIWMRGPEEEMVFGNVEKPAYLALCRGFLFYGAMDYEPPVDELYRELSLERDAVNRYRALLRIAETEKLRLLREPGAGFSDRFIETYFRLLSDRRLGDELGASHCAIPFSVEDRFLKHRYHDLFAIQKLFRRTLAERYGDRLLALYSERQERKLDAPFVERRLFDIRNREVKNAALAILAELDTPVVRDLVRTQFNEAGSATDRYVAFGLYINSDAPDRLDLIRSYEDVACRNLVEFEVYLSRIGSLETDDVVDRIIEAERSPRFRMDQSADQRALFMRFTDNKRISMQTDRGREYLEHVLGRMCAINEFNAVSMLSSFSKINDFPDEYRAPLVELLAGLYRDTERIGSAAVSNTIKRLLKGAPDAVEAYERSTGRKALQTAD